MALLQQEAVAQVEAVTALVQVVQVVAGHLAGLVLVVMGQQILVVVGLGVIKMQEMVEQVAPA
jgi:hypothetical protein